MRLRKPITRRFFLQLFSLNAYIAVFALGALLVGTNWFRELPGNVPGTIHWQSLLILCAAASCGLVYGRFLPRHPGKTGISAVIAPVFVFTLIVVLVSGLFRMDLSRFVVLAGFAGEFAWMLHDMWMYQLAGDPHYLVMQVGGARQLVGHSPAKWSEAEDMSKNADMAIDGVLTDFSKPHDVAAQRFILDTVAKGIPVYDYRAARESLLGMVSVSSLSDSALGLHLPNTPYMALKRLMDVLIAVLLVLPVLAVTALFAALIWLGSRQSPFFLQTRMGLHGQPFTIYKLRSMRTGPPTEATADYTQTNDPRVTRFGQFIRRFRIDELPQIINVIKGDMSWIGPRPEQYALALDYETRIPFYAYRHTVRPGISGWAQVTQGYVDDAKDVETKLQYDFYYIKNVSFWLDVLIFLKTQKTILGGFGAR